MPLLMQHCENENKSCWYYCTSASPKTILWCKLRSCLHFEKFCVWFYNFERNAKRHSSVDSYQLPAEDTSQDANTNLINFIIFPNLSR